MNNVGGGGAGGVFVSIFGFPTRAGNGIAGSDPDLSGAFTSLGHNLLGLSGGSLGLINGVNGDLVGTAAAPINPLLGPLANNGGPTFTMALLPGSPAIDAGDDTLTGADQRGFPRLCGQHVDIGAYELNAASLGYAAPAVTAATCVLSNAGSGLFSALFSAAVNPNGLNTTVCLQYGITSNSGAATPSVSAGYGTNATNMSLILTGLAPGATFQYQIVATSPAGTTRGPTQTFTTGPAGDLTGAGVVTSSDYDQVLASYLLGGGAISAAEYGVVLSNYLAHSPWLALTNAAGLGGTNVTFGLTNNLTGSFTVQYSTNLAGWTDLGPATPLYEFTDTNAAGAPQRFYRLSWP
jgi:hypothetical protein